MWKGEFMRWAVNIEALSDEEAETWWSEIEADPRIPRDDLGYNGRLQLWVPNMKSKINDKGSYIDYRQEQGNKPLQEVTDANIKMLRDHLQRQNNNFNANFLRECAAAAATTGKRVAEDSEPATLEAEAATKDLKHRKVVDVEREAPKFSRTMEKDLATLRKSLEAAKTKYSAAVHNLSTAEVVMLVGDNALYALLRSFDLRCHFHARREGTSPTPKCSHKEVLDRVSGAEAQASEEFKALSDEMVENTKAALNKGHEEFDKLCEKSASTMQRLALPPKLHTTCHRLLNLRLLIYLIGAATGSRKAATAGNFGQTIQLMIS